MNVSKWGPGGWVFLHSITFNYPLDPENEDKLNVFMDIDKINTYSE